MNKKPKLFSLTFDMDGIDVLCEGYGIETPYSPLVYEKAVPRILDFLNEVNIRATFFIIANRLSDRTVRNSIREIVKQGHEIANHSYDHQHYLDRSYSETEEDIKKSTEILNDITGRAVLGFRGPSLTFNRFTPELLEKHGYTYDSSIHPTPLFLFEWLYLSFFSAQKRNRPNLFFLRHAFNRLTPYPVSATSLFKKDINGRIVEFPISTVPFLRIPYYPTFHFMLKPLEALFRPLFYLNRQIVFLAHGLDFLNIEADGLPSGFRRHPGMKLPLSKKKEYFRRIIEQARKRHDVCTLARQREAFQP